MRNSSPALKFGLPQVTVCTGNAKIGRFKYNVPVSIIFWVFRFLRLYNDIHQCRAQSLWSVRQRIMFGLISWSPIGFSECGISLIWNLGFGIWKQNGGEISLRTANVCPRSLPLRDVSPGGTSATQRPTEIPYRWRKISPESGQKR